MSKGISLRQAYVGFGRGFEQMKVELLAARTELAQHQWQPIETAPHETPVLVVRLGKVCIAEKRTETPAWDEDFKPYDYWDNPDNDGQDWTDQITHWMPIPALPTT